MKKAKVGITEEVLAPDPTVLERLFKYGGIELTIISSKSATGENILQVMRQYEGYKRVAYFRFAGAVPRDSDILIFDGSQLELARQYLKTGYYKMVFVKPLDGMESTFEDDPPFKICTMMSMDEWIREFLNIPVKVKKERKPGKRGKKKNEDQSESEDTGFTNSDTPF